MTNFLRENQHLFIALILVGVLMLIYKTYDLHMLAAKTDAKVTGMRVRSGMGAAGVYTTDNSQVAFQAGDISSINLTDLPKGDSSGAKYVIGSSGFRSGMGDLEPPVFWNPGSYSEVAQSQAGTGVRVMVNGQLDAGSGVMAGIETSNTDWGDSSDINTGATKTGTGVNYVDSTGKKYTTNNVVTTVYDANGKVISTTQGTKYGTNLSGMVGDFVQNAPRISGMAPNTSARGLALALGGY